MRAVAAVIGIAILCGGDACAQTASVPSSPATIGSAPSRWTIGAEALIWWFKSSPAPVPLVTDGLVDDPAAHVLLGGRSVDTGANAGLRLTAGYAVSDRWGLEGSLLYIPSRSSSSSVASDGTSGSTDLVVPYIDGLTHLESGTQISLAPVYRGDARVDFSNSLLGGELNGVWPLAPAGAWRLDLIGGFRYLRLRETYRLTTDSLFIPPFPQDIWNTSDDFAATNNFYGAQAGIRARLDQGAFFAAGSFKIAVGAMAQSVDVNGSLVTNDFNNFGVTQAFPGGYFALPTNIGNYSRTTFAVVPEVALGMGYRITPTVAITFGYSFLYASSVARPGNQIDRNINTSQSVAYSEDPAARLAGAALPTFHFNDSTFWAQGINVGLAVRF